MFGVQVKLLVNHKYTEKLEISSHRSESKLQTIISTPVNFELHSNLSFMHKVDVIKKNRMTSSYVIF